MPHEGAGNLIAAVAEAMGGKKPDLDNFEDRLLMQKGCFILNCIGVSPKYRFNLYIRGPYSSELADDCRELLKGDGIAHGSDVPSDKIRELSDIMDKGTSFVEAYATLKLAFLINPGMNEDKVINFVIGMEPRLEKKIREASAYR